jgi:iron complex outermembrane receptor protein
LLPDDPMINCGNNTACEAGEYGHPKLLAQAGVNWDLGPWTSTATMHYTDSYMVDRTPSETINSYYDLYAKGYFIPSNTTFDASVAYAGFKNTVLRFGVNNMFNRDPSFDPSSNLGYDIEYGNPRGRYVYAAISYKFK